MYKLYVFLRSDMESLSVGKAAAQVAHAASQCAFLGHKENNQAYLQWEQSAVEEVLEGVNVFPYRTEYEGFGTTIVLDAKNLSMKNKLPPTCELSGSITDPSYPVRDGNVTHLININTCYWVFEDPDLNSKFRSYVEEFKLY